MLPRAPPPDVLISFFSTTVWPCLSTRFHGRLSARRDDKQHESLNSSSCPYIINQTNNSQTYKYNTKLTQNQMSRKSYSKKRFKSYINIFRNGKNPHYTENIYSCGLNVLLDRSGHSTVEIICFFIIILHIPPTPPPDPRRHHVPLAQHPQHPESLVPFLLPS
jgi:hypothetical protein